MTTMIQADEVNFTVNPAISSLLPDVSNQELQLLTRDIQTEGKAYEPVTVWKEEQVLVDGHNRFKICADLKLPLSVDERSFKNINEVKKFVYVKQLSRRNLQPLDAKYSRGQLYNLLKAEKKDNLPNGTAKPKADQNIKLTSGPNPTAKIVAEQTGVSSAQVIRDGQFATGVEEVAEIKGPEAKKKILNAGSKVTSGDVERVAKAKTPEEKKELADLAISRAEAKEAKQPVVATSYSGPTRAQYEPVMNAARAVVAAKSPQGQKQAIEGLQTALKMFDATTSTDTPSKVQPKVVEKTEFDD